MFLNLMLIQVFASIYRCCCCFDLRTGSIIIAILHIVVSLGILSLVLWNYQGDLSTAIPLSTLLDCVAGVAVGICLLVGVIKSNASAILVYLILSPINFIIRCVVWSLSFGIFAVLSIFWDSHKRHQIDEGHVLGIFIIGITITVMALSIYFWFCVYRFYQLTKYGKVTSCA